MSASKSQVVIIIACVGVGVVQVGGCSTSVLNPSVPPVPPTFTQVPHPQGTDLGDLDALLLYKGAPRDPNFSTTCDDDFSKLKKSTESKTELNQGIEELVKQDPIHYHWCFYARMAKLEGEIKKDSYVDERQKKLIGTYEFLVPIARVFNSKFHDSRYLRWAIMRYRKLSEWIFYRKLELTPQGTAEFVQPENAFGLWRSPAESKSIMEKYHLGDPQTGMWTGPVKPLPEMTARSSSLPELPPLGLEMPEELPLMPPPHEGELREGELLEGLAIPPSPDAEVPSTVVSPSPQPSANVSAAPPVEQPEVPPPGVLPPTAPASIQPSALQTAPLPTTAELPK